MADAARWRIGELSRRVGVSVQVLRAWERRYGLLEPTRTSGGFRLYSDADERRVRDVVALRAEGHSAAEAAAAVLARAGTDEPRPGARSLPAPPGAAELDTAREQLRRALDATDEPATHAAFDALLAATDLATGLTEVVLPELARIGERWASGAIGVDEEHYASNLVQGRLLALARGWGEGNGPRAVLACAPGEQHALGLIAFGLILRRAGWRIAYLGPDTPVDSLLRSASGEATAAVVVSAVAIERFRESAKPMRAAARQMPLAVGGAGATAAMARRLGATALDDDPRRAAAQLLAIAA